MKKLTSILVLFLIACVHVEPRNPMKRRENIADIDTTVVAPIQTKTHFEPEPGEVY